MWQQTPQANMAHADNFKKRSGTYPLKTEVKVSCHLHSAKLYHFNPRVTARHVTSVLPSFKRVVLLYESNGRLLGILQVCTQTGNFPYGGIMAIGGGEAVRFSHTPYTYLEGGDFLLLPLSNISLHWCWLQEGPGFPGFAISPPTTWFDGTCVLFTGVILCLSYFVLYQYIG